MSCFHHLGGPVFLAELQVLLCKETKQDVRAKMDGEGFVSIQPAAQNSSNRKPCDVHIGIFFFSSFPEIPPLGGFKIEQNRRAGWKKNIGRFCQNTGNKNNRIAGLIFYQFHLAILNSRPFSTFQPTEVAAQSQVCTEQSMRWQRQVCGGCH